MIRVLRKWYNHLSFFRKQLLVAVVVTIVTLTLASILLYSQYSKDYQKHVVQDLQSKARLFSTTIQSALIFNDVAAAKAILDTSEAYKDTRQVMVFDTDMNLFAEFRNEAQSSFIKKAQLNQGVQFSGDIMIFFAPIDRDGEILGYIAIAADTAASEREKQQYALIMLLVFVFSILVSCLLHWRMQKLITRPMSKLIDLVGFVARNRQYDKRLGVGRHDELGHLISGVNSMLDTIQEHERQLHDNSERLESLVALRTEQLFNRANYDALTQLPNRHLLVDRLKHGIDYAERESTKMALMFLDLDRFKIINDSLGHSIGDELLVKVAETLKKIVRRADSVCRWGGDEFVILLEHFQKNDEIEPLAEKIISALSQPFEVSGHQLHVSTSIGIARYPDDGKDTNTLLKHADMSMYKAKEQGPGRYCFFEEAMLDGSVERLSLEIRLRKALDQKSFHLVYQPQIATDTGAVCGIEALIRWQDEKLGLLNPIQFLPVAEDVGLMNQLSLWVLEEACRQNKEWQDKGATAQPIAVNLPASFIAHPNSVAKIKDILERTGLLPRYLEIEITENTFITNTDHAIKVLETLKNMGISIAVDDFGTGYSSMSYLRDLPVGTLKIDGSFIRQLGQSDANDGIIESIITLGKSLDLTLVAECVESQEQAKILKELGCDVIQGYYYSKPLSPEKTEAFLLEKANP